MVDEIVVFFENLTSLKKVIWIVFCLSIFWILEGVYPLKRHQYKKWKHAKTNFILLGSTIIINVLFGILAFIMLQRAKR